MGGGLAGGPPAAVADDDDAGDAPARAPRATRSYADCFDDDTPAGEFLAALARPFPRGPSDGSGLSELALGVACEQRAAWRPPGAAPVNAERAEAVVTQVIRRDHATVLGYVWTHFPGAADHAAVATDAWSIVYERYWSPQATRLFLARSRISTFVCCVAHKLALRSSTESDGPAAALDLAGFQGALACPRAARGADCADFRAALACCKERLTPTERMVFEAVREQGYTQAGLARERGRSVVSVHLALQQAEAKLRPCLARRGYGDPARPPPPPPRAAVALDSSPDGRTHA